MDKRQIGQYAEEYVLAYLLHLGLHLIQKNFHSRYGEIDLIMRDQNNCLCFIEVRARSSNSYVTAIESVDERKQLKIIQTAQIFLQKFPKYENYECRFDVLALKYDSHTFFIKNNIDLNSQQTVNLHWIKHAYTM